MGRRYFKLTGGQNIRLATISARLAVLCGDYLLNGKPIMRDSYEDRRLLRKGREYFNYVRRGSVIKKKLQGLSFDPETLHSINAYDEVNSVEENVDEILVDIEKTLDTLEGKEEISDEILVKSFDFFTDLAENSRGDDSYHEASHVL